MGEKTLNIKEELAGIDAKVEELEQAKKLGEAIERLHENEDFKMFIIDGYFEAESERIFQTLVTPSKMKREQLENMMDKLGSIRDLKDYTGVKLIEAAGVDEEVAELREYRKEVTARGSEGA